MSNKIVENFYDWWDYEEKEGTWVHKSKKECAELAWGIILDELHSDILNRNMDVEDILYWLRHESEYRRDYNLVRRSFQLAGSNTNHKNICQKLNRLEIPLKDDEVEIEKDPTEINKLT